MTDFYVFFSYTPKYSAKKAIGLSPYVGRSAAAPSLLDDKLGHISVY